MQMHVSCFVRSIKTMIYGTGPSYLRKVTKYNQFIIHLTCTIRQCIARILLKPVYSATMYNGYIWILLLSVNKHFVYINSSKPSVEYMRTLVQIMASRMAVTNPLSKPMLSYRQLEPYEQTSMKF